MQKERSNLLINFLNLFKLFGDYRQLLICSVVDSCHNSSYGAVADGGENNDLICSGTQCNAEVRELSANHSSLSLVCMLGSRIHNRSLISVFMHLQN